MSICGILFWAIIIMLVISGVSYIIGFNKAGDIALDLIRFVIITLLIIVLIGLLMYLFGNLTWTDVRRFFPDLKNLDYLFIIVNL